MSVTHKQTDDKVLFQYRPVKLGESKIAKLAHDSGAGIAALNDIVSIAFRYWLVSSFQDSTQVTRNQFD